MNVLKKWRALLLGFIYVLFGALPVLADDTEIYFGAGGANEATRNNILFVIDTSGSMAEDDGDGVARIDELKTAFKSLLRDLSNVNVGLMRFSDPGGPVLYPVTNIHQVVPDAGVTSTPVNRSIGNVADDAFQLNTAGTVDVSSQRLPLGTTVSSGAVPYTFTQRISTSTDDGSSLSVGDTTTLGGVELIRRSGALFTESVVGVRFNKVSIPKTAVIQEAYVQFTVSSTASAPPVSMTISAEKIASSSTFSSNTNDNRVSKRAASDKVFAETVAWNVTGTMPAVGTQVRTADLSMLVTKMIAEPTWSTDKPLTFFYRAANAAETGRLNFYSSDASNAATTAPQLIIKYSVGSGAPVTSDVTTAMRFTAVDIPRNARITSARLDFTAAHSSSDAANFQIYGEKVESAAAFSTTNFNLTGRTSRTSPIIWNSASTPALSPWEIYETYSTPDISALVQEIVDQSSWCAGNNLALFITGAGQRFAYSSDLNSNLAPRLVLTYDPASITAGNTCVQASLARQISAVADDAEEDAGGTANLGNEALRLAAGNNKARQVGLRFTNIAIPPKSKIQSAYLQVYAYENSKAAVTLSIAGQKTPDAPTFAAKTGDIGNRTKTSAKVTWSLPDTVQWTSGTVYQSPDISSILQELVNLENVSTPSGPQSWTSGNDVALIISGSSNSVYRRINGRNQQSSSGTTAKLVVNYLDNGSTLRTVKDVLIETVDGLSAEGWTPLQDTFYEAVQYFRGGPVDYGKQRGITYDRWGNQIGYAGTRVSHPGSMVPGTYTITPSGCQNSSSDSCKNEKITGNAMYKSPVTYACQANHIVLLTDGEPNFDHSAAKIKALPGFPTGTCSYDNNGSSRYAGGECVPELARWAYQTTDISDLPGRQNIVVDTIAFYQGSDSTEFLTNTSKNAGGMSLAASNTDDLLKALERITVGTISENASFVSAGTAVNSFNRMQNRDDLYFSVFKPQKYPQWPGNLKKYKVALRDDPSTAEVATVPVLVDANNALAVDPASGFFKDSSRSYWSSVVDGPEVTKGGASAMITNYATRKVYSNLSANIDLAASTNALVTSNALVNRTVFATDAATYGDTAFANLVEWIRGKDVKDEDANASTTTRFVMADPLHSRPVAITYKGTDASPDTTLYVASNGGALHAINDADGTELFAFMPKELLPNQKFLYENVESIEHPYGLDGSITTWVIDPDGDGLVLNSDGSVQSGNRAVIVVGMGRGGNNYYALDVTDRAHPQLLWTIKGGVDTGFEQLGQTWSQPEKAMIKVGSDATTRRVLILGGGYDPAQDDTSIRATDAQGAAVYIVDLLTGSLVWRAGKGSEYNLNLSAMNYGIPAQVTSADVSGDGLTDVFFVGDMGGQVWRFDIANKQPAATLVTGGVIADLGVGGVANGPNVAASNRRFYHSPTIFPGLDSNNNPYLGVAIGSGYRGHPLNEDTLDMFYMIRQSSVFGAPTSYSTVRLADLYDATDNLAGQGTAAEQSAALTAIAGKQGWYIRLTNSGEKVLSTPIVSNNQVSFSTYEPNTSGQVNPCMPQTGTNRLYNMFVADGTPSVDRNLDGGFTIADRGKVIATPGIVTTGAIINVGGTVGFVYGATIEEDNLDKNIKRIYWYENRAR